MLGGTELIRRKLGKDAHAMTITLLLNSEGKKMGKTASGAVWLDPNKTSPFDFYQYWRNIGDEDVLKCIRMLTFLPLEQIDEMDKWEGSQLNTREGNPRVRADKARPRRGGSPEGRGRGEGAVRGRLGRLQHADDRDHGRSADRWEDRSARPDAGLRPHPVEGRGAANYVQQGGVMVNDEKVANIDVSFTGEQLKEGLKIRKGKKVFHKAILK